MVWLVAMSLHAVEPRSLMAPGAAVKEVAGGYSVLGGLAAGQDGQIYFADVPNNRILMRLPDGTIGTWLEDSGGAKGLWLFAGDLYACQETRRQVVAIGADKLIKPVSVQSGGKRFNSPDDLWVDAAGGVYFTDPHLGNESEHVFYIAEGVAEAKVVASDFIRPNGIVGTTNGRALYVADDDGGKVLKFNIPVPGKLADRMKFCDEGSDGMCLDEKGNLYLTWKMGVQIYAPDGTKIGTIATPVNPTDVCFGGAAHTTLFITGGRTLLSIEMSVRGVE